MSRAYFLTICVIIFQHTGRIFIRCYALYIYIYICGCACVYVCMYVCIYIYIYSYHTFFLSLYLYVPDEGSILSKYRDCTTSNDFELCIYIYIYIYIYIHAYIYAYIHTHTYMYCNFVVVAFFRLNIIIVHAPVEI